MNERDAPGHGKDRTECADATGTAEYARSRHTLPSHTIHEWTPVSVSPLDWLLLSVYPTMFGQVLPTIFVR